MPFPMRDCPAFSSSMILAIRRTSSVAYLAPHGYEVHVAYDWAIALETAKAHLPDIILLDLGMPEMDGIHLALLFREDEQLKDKLLVAVTGYADDKHRQQCEAAGFDYVLPKPVAWADLKSTIDRLWSNRKLP